MKELKVGDKLIAIDECLINNGRTSLTIGKDYEVLNIDLDSDEFYIKNDYGSIHYFGIFDYDKYFKLPNDPKVNIINPTKSSVYEIIETNDLMLESIIQFRINIIEDNQSQLEKVLFNNENLNDFTKTELMKEVIGYSKQKDVLESILKDYDLRKLTLQCEK